MRNAKEAIQDLVKFNTIFPVVAELCEVVSYDDSKITVSARSLKTDNFYSSVRLTATEGKAQGVVSIPQIGATIFVIKMDQFDNYIGFVSASANLSLITPELVISNEDRDFNNFDVIGPDGEILEAEALRVWIYSDNSAFLVNPTAISLKHYFTGDRDQTDTAMWVAENDATISANDLKVFIEVSKDGVKIEKDGVNLKQAMTDLKTAIGALTVPTPSGPSGTPNNIVQINSAFDDIIEILN